MLICYFSTEKSFCKTPEDFEFLSCKAGLCLEHIQPHTYEGPMPPSYRTRIIFNEPTHAWRTIKVCGPCDER